jgi:fructoselysine-6-phosphate deglycase
MLKFDEKNELNSVNGALAIRLELEKIVDEICNEGYKNIC